MKEVYEALNLLSNSGRACANQIKRIRSCINSVEVLCDLVSILVPTIDCLNIVIGTSLNLKCSIDQRYEKQNHFFKSSVLKVKCHIKL